MLLVCLESDEENASLAAHVSWGAWEWEKNKRAWGKRRQRQQGGITKEQMRPGSLWGRLLAANFSHETSRSSIFGHRFKNKRGTVLSDRWTDRWTHRWTDRSVDEQFYFSNKLFIRKNRMELFINGCETTLLLLLLPLLLLLLLRLGARQKASFTLNYCASHKCQRNMRIPNESKNKKNFWGRINRNLGDCHSGREVKN